MTLLIPIMILLTLRLRSRCPCLNLPMQALILLNALVIVTCGDIGSF